MTGAIIWGWGMAAMEASHHEPTLGRWLSKNLAGVAIPVNADIPGDLQIHFVDEFDAHASPLGAKGIGELGATGVAAAVANAVFHATGKRVRELPDHTGQARVSVAGRAPVQRAEERAGTRKRAIDPNDAVILLIDDQSGLFQVVKDIPLPQLRANLVALARAATLAKIPVEEAQLKVGASRALLVCGDLFAQSLWRVATYSRSSGARSK